MHDNLLYIILHTESFFFFTYIWIPFRHLTRHLTFFFFHIYLNSFSTFNSTFNFKNNINQSFTCTYLYSSYDSSLVNIFHFKNPFDYLIEKYANPWKIRERKCGGRRFALIFEELRFLAISRSLVSSFLRRKKKQ